MGNSNMRLLLVCSLIFIVTVHNIYAEDNYAHTGGDTIPIVKDKLYEHYQIPYIGKEFLISFELYINSISEEEWQNVLHITTGDNIGKMGDRIPGVWVTDKKELYVSFAINGNKN